MIYHSTFRIDMSRANEWLACLWQGPAPAEMKVREWITLTGVTPRTSILVWEGGEEAKAFVDRVFGQFGELETHPATSSSGMASAVARDLEGYEKMMQGRGVDAVEIGRQVDLRRRGMKAPTPAAAIDAAHAWESQSSK